MMATSTIVNNGGLEMAKYLMYHICKMTLFMGHIPIMELLKGDTILLGYQGNVVV